MKLSLVIPCFNEGPNVPKLIKRLNQVFNSNEFQVILVDNGSTDNTKELVVEEFGKSEENVKDGMDIALCCIEGDNLKYADCFL